jgi:hypothetical protein
VPTSVSRELLNQSVKSMFALPEPPIVLPVPEGCVGRVGPAAELHQFAEQSIISVPAYDTAWAGLTAVRLLSFSLLVAMLPGNNVSLNRTSPRGDVNTLEPLPMKSFSATVQLSGPLDASAVLLEKLVRLRPHLPLFWKRLRRMVVLRIPP